ncbi:MAG: hypothetical protein AB7V18_09145 [Pyrinomonadaceae bacterium]
MHTSTDLKVATWPPRTPTLRRRLYSALFLFTIWTSSMLFLLLGLPFLIYQAISSLFAKKD